VNRLHSINIFLAVFIAALACYGYVHLFSYGLQGYYESLEGYIFLLLFTSPVVLANLIFSFSLFAGKYKFKQVILCLVPSIIYCVVPFLIAIGISHLTRH